MNHLHGSRDAFHRVSIVFKEVWDGVETIPAKAKAVFLLCTAICFTATAQINPPLASTLAELTKPTQELPFKQVVEATTHHQILDFDTNNPAHVRLQKKILAAAKLAGEQARKEGIASVRANEAGNHIEPLVKAALRQVGLFAETPTNSLGKAQITGYPDIEIAGQPPSYLELKTYNAATADTTQRTFYYSPSEHPKVTHDALHLLLAFQLEKVERDSKTVFVPVHWKLISLQNLQVHLKFEFNQSNRGLYGSDAANGLLNEGEIR